MTIEEIRAELAKQGMVAIIWEIGDVQDVRGKLTDKEAMHVLRFAEDHHDATLGVNWDTLEMIAEELYPDSDNRPAFCIKARIDAEDTHGYNVHDYFRADVLHEVFNTEAEAETAAQEAYKGPDTDGVGCSWSIEEDLETALRAY
jgi:hypothetical protein